ncbi:DUF2254 domain-containing protein [Haloferula sargassicola]|uniref:DUF2254 domain-containing protein n=1 Tax=Haloferula sargassicola TaxID=490096 RepID=A0ABP9UI64_9BACT
MVVFRRYLSALWGSMGFVPGLIAAASMALGVILSGAVGRSLLDSVKEPAFDPQSASAVLTSLAGGAITVAAVVLSITMVVLSSASSQFGPRLLPNFMRKSGTKLAMGGFVGSFAYQIVVASALGLGERVPDLAVWVGIVGSLAAFAILLAFVQMVSRFIQVPYIIDEVTHDLHRALEKLARHGSAEPMGEMPGGTGQAVTVRSDRDGYVQLIDLDRLVQLATEAGGCIVSRVRAGSFVPGNGTLASLHGTSDLEVHKVRACFGLGPNRSQAQDVEFAIRQLVEIAVRALSPGINDPHTAINAIDRLAGAFADIAACGVRSGLLRDDQGKVRLRVPLPGVDDLFDAAYHPLRQNARAVEAVAIALLDSYRALADLPKLHPDVRGAVEKHARLLLEDFEVAKPSEYDLQEFRKRFDALMELLAAQDSSAA